MPQLAIVNPNMSAIADFLHVVLRPAPTVLCR